MKKIHFFPSVLRNLDDYLYRNIERTIDSRQLFIYIWEYFRFFESLLVKYIVQVDSIKIDRIFDEWSFRIQKIKFISYLI